MQNIGVVDSSPSDLDPLLVSERLLGGAFGLEARLAIAAAVIETVADPLLRRDELVAIRLQRLGMVESHACAALNSNMLHERNSIELFLTSFRDLCLFVSCRYPSQGECRAGGSKAKDAP